MAELLPNSFTSYSLNDDEEIQGSILTLPQIQMIQNDLTIYAEERLALQFNPNEPVLFAQQEAYLRGQMDTLRYLLTRSDASVEAVATLHIDPQE